MPERSFFCGKYQMPVCARCTGMMIGYLVAIVLFIMDMHLTFIASILLILPLIIDGSIQYKTRYTSNNLKRLVTGIMYGIGLIQLLANLIAYIIGVLYE